MRIRMLEPVQNKIPKKKRVCAYARGFHGFQETGRIP